MEWNSIQMAQKFLQRANALHPEEGASEGRFEEELARQELLYECYMMSFSKEKLISFLNDAIAGKTKLPDEVKLDDESRYRSAYAQEAKVLMIEVEKL
jgi:hypothetical protein